MKKPLGNCIGCRNNNWSASQSFNGPLPEFIIDDLNFSIHSIHPSKIISSAFMIDMLSFISSTRYLILDMKPKYYLLALKCIKAQFGATLEEISYCNKGKRAQPMKPFKKKKRNEISDETSNRPICYERPNYFISLRVNDKKICEVIGTVQESMVKARTDLIEGLIAKNTLHLTLMVIKLDEFNCIHKAEKAMKNVEQKWKAEEKEIHLNFSGVGNFKNEVVFAKISEDQGYKDLVQLQGLVEDAFEEEGIYSTDQKPFSNPHLTIAKTSKMRKPKYSKKHKKWWKIDAKSYEKLEDVYFGFERIKELHLCSMTREKQDDGYYFTPYAIDI